MGAGGRGAKWEQLVQLGGPSLPAVCDRHEDRKLAGLQSGACQCAVVDRRDHPIQLPNTTGNAFAFNPLGSFGHWFFVYASYSDLSSWPLRESARRNAHFATNSHKRNRRTSIP